MIKLFDALFRTKLSLSSVRVIDVQVSEFCIAGRSVIELFDDSLCLYFLLDSPIDKLILF